MATSLITKKRIAKSFKKLLTEQAFEKISVRQIMEDAGIRRQTFYNHFLDKYELLEWIFQTELREQIWNISLAISCCKNYCIILASIRAFMHNYLTSLTKMTFLLIFKPIVNSL